MLRDAIRTAALNQGFTLCGIAPAIESTGHSDLIRWIDAGYAGQMQYFADRLDAYRHPSGVLVGARSVIALAYPYPKRTSPPQRSGHGKVARYAWSGVDYHDVIHPKLKSICGVINETMPGALARGVVDTAPISEREIAQLAGLGWSAKNTLLIHPGLGSYFFLACVLIDVDLPVDDAFTATHCGTCTACLDACPTSAFVRPGVLDASRCISYLTIEHRDSIDVSLRPLMGDWVFGCDVCQEVCPWNRKPARTEDRQVQHGQDRLADDPMESLKLGELFSLDEKEFRAKFRKSPMWRTRRRGLLRNAAIVLGNQAEPSSVNSLAIGLHDVEPLVRGAAAWALGQIGTAEAIAMIHDRIAIETDDEVVAELTMVAKTRPNPGMM